MKNPENITNLLAATEVIMHPDDYSIVCLPIQQKRKMQNLNIKPFYSLTFEKDTISLVLKEVEWNLLKRGFDEFLEEGPFRLITFNLELDLSVVGYLAAISNTLASEGISIYAVSTFLKDHILVKNEDAKAAMVALAGLINDSRSGKFPDTRECY